MVGFADWASQSIYHSGSCNLIQHLRFRQRQAHPCSHSLPKKVTRSTQHTPTFAADNPPAHLIFITNEFAHPPRARLALRFELQYRLDLFCPPMPSISIRQCAVGRGTSLLAASPGAILACKYFLIPPRDKHPGPQASIGVTAAPYNNER